MTEHDFGNSFKKVLKIIGNIYFTIITITIIIIFVIAVKARIEGNVPSLFGYKLYYVSSGSMSPTIPKGSLIMVKEMAAFKIQKTDVISFRGSQNSIVTHRVMTISENKQNFTTRGDANESNDPLPVKAGDIVGKVILHIPFVGFLIKLFQSKHVLLLIIVILTLKILVCMLVKKHKPIKNKEESL